MNITRTAPNRGYWAFLLPGAIALAPIIILPFLVNVGVSFTNWNGVSSPVWIGLGNYDKALNDATFWASFKNNLYIIVAMVIIPTLVGLLLAAFLYDYVSSKLGKGVASFFRAGYYLPQILPVAIAGVVWRWIMQPNWGVLNWMLNAVGLESQNWLGDADLAIYSVMAIMVWFQIGYPLVIFMAALQRVDPELYEAASVDGATWFDKFFHITIHQIRPEIFVVVLTTLIHSLKVFAQIFVLTRGGPGRATIVPSYFAYQNFFEKSSVGYGATIATIMTVIIIILTVIFINVQSGQERQEGIYMIRTRPANLQSNPTRPIDFRPSKLLALVGLIVLLVIMLFPFFIVIINAIKSPAEYANNGPMSLPQGIYLQGLIDFWNRVDFTNKLANSLVISLTVAILGVGLSLFNAFALGIGRVRGRVWFLVFFLMANTLPQESLAYPLYYFAKFLGIYNSQIAVILVFTVIQSAFGTYLLTSVFSAFPREINEAALIDGCSKIQLLFRIVMPISMPTLSVLFVFFFIWTWNEFFLPMVLLVSTSKQTVPLAIAVLQGQHNMDATTSSSSALLGLLPCLVFFVLFQRTLTKGITAGSIK